MEIHKHDKIENKDLFEIGREKYNSIINKNLKIEDIILIENKENKIIIKGIEENVEMIVLDLTKLNKIQNNFNFFDYLRELKDKLKFQKYELIEIGIVNNPNLKIPHYGYSAYRILRNI